MVLCGIRMLAEQFLESNIDIEENMEENMPKTNDNVIDEAMPIISDLGAYIKITI